MQSRRHLKSKKKERRLEVRMDCEHFKARSETVSSRVAQGKQILLLHCYEIAPAKQQVTALWQSPQEHPLSFL